jgi:TRAP-type C4-dicarboxylate transport system permease small subunit
MNSYIFEEIVMSILFFLLLFFGGLNIVLRYSFNTAIPYVSDMIVDGFVWLSLIGLPVACYRGVNMNLTLFYDFFPDKLKKACIILAGLISICLFSYLFYTGSKFLFFQYKFKHTTSVPFIPRYFWTIAFPISASLYIIRTIQYTIYELKNFNKTTDAITVAVDEILETKGERDEH